MKATFPYQQFPEVEIPDENLLGVFSLSTAVSPHPVANLVRRALENPIDSAPLTELAAGKQKVLIVTDDVSRPTPAWQIIPGVLEELARAGVADDHISFMMALGTHRPMTDAEMRAKVGDAVFERFHVYNHAWDDPSALVSLGKSEFGVDIWINKKVMEADLVIGIGRIMPLDVCGFGGGGKILIPGCCGEETLDMFHWIRVEHPDEEVVGQRENPIRDTIDAMARKAGLDFVVNVVMDGEKNILDCVAGDFVAAHRAGCETAKAFHSVEIPAAPDIVVVDGYPFDIEFWQVNKAVDTAGLVVREGGVVICVSPCYEGLSQTHAPEILRYGYRPRNEIIDLVDSGKIRPRVVGVHMIQVSHVCHEKAEVILVTDGISQSDVERLGLRYAGTPQDALEQAFTLLGRNAKVAVLRGAAEMLAVLPPVEASVN